MSEKRLRAAAKAASDTFFGSATVQFAPGRYKLKRLSLGDILQRDFLVNERTGKLVCGCERFTTLNFVTAGWDTFAIECDLCKTTWSSVDVEP